MTRNLIPIEAYIEASRVFHWATKRHFQLWFTGEEKKRHRRTETVLKRLVRRGKLRTAYYGKKLIYSSLRKKSDDEFYGLSKAVHGLSCTECLVRFYRSRMDGVVVAERFFVGCGSVPEWGIIYPEGTMLLLEFCTKSNFLFTGNMRGKLSAYQRNLEKIENKFQAKAIVVFVIDVPPGVVERWAGSDNAGPARSAALRTGGDTFPLPFFFTDYKTFKEVPLGDQLTAPIYIWSDGNKYPLTKNVRLESD